jgi:hypothetical protein
MHILNYCVYSYERHAIKGSPNARPKCKVQDNVRKNEH